MALARQSLRADALRGVKFESIDLRPAGGVDTHGVRGLYTSPKGDLWLSYERGGAVELKQGRLDSATSFPGLPNKSVQTFSEDGDGRLWAATLGELWILEGTRWEAAQSSWNLPKEKGIDDLALDTDGSLWVAANDILYVLRKGSHHFDRTDESSTGLFSITHSSSGELLSLPIVN
jgi:ligand-binding sensor domain-containing protein